MIVIRELEPAEVARLAEVDATETGFFVYELVDGALVEKPEQWRRPPWSVAEAEHHVDRATALATGDGAVLAALDGERLVGYATLRPRLTTDTAQLQDVQVSVSHRRRGIARRLVEEIVELARAGGARCLYVSATPSESAVGLYRSLGFEITDEPHPELLELEPEDIHMTRRLRG